MLSRIDSLVLATVNAPYSKKLDLQTLVLCLMNPAHPAFFSGPVSSFFTDVKPELKKQFATHHKIPASKMQAANSTYNMLAFGVAA